MDENVTNAVKNNVTVTIQTKAAEETAFVNASGFLISIAVDNYNTENDINSRPINVVEEKGSPVYYIVGDSVHAVLVFQNI